MCDLILGFAEFLDPRRLVVGAPVEEDRFVARHATAYGIDLWNYTAPNGASLRKGLEFLTPYNQTPEKWPTSQNERLPKGFLDQLLAEAANAKPAA